MFPFTFLFNASMTRRTRMILMTNSLTSVTTRKKSITSKDTFWNDDNEMVSDIVVDKEDRENDGTPYREPPSKCIHSHT